MKKKLFLLFLTTMFLSLVFVRPALAQMDTEALLNAAEKAGGAAAAGTAMVGAVIPPAPVIIAAEPIKEIKMGIGGALAILPDSEFAIAIAGAIGWLIGGGIANILVIPPNGGFALMGWMEIKKILIHAH